MGVKTASGPQAWAAGKDTPELVFPVSAVSVTMTSHPNSLRGYGNTTNSGQRVDLSLARQVRLTARVSTVSASVNNPRVVLLAKTGAFDTTIGNYSNIGETEVACSVFTGTTLADSGWININSAFRDDVAIVLGENGGDGSASPVVQSVWLHVR